MKVSLVRGWTSDELRDALDRNDDVQVGHVSPSADHKWNALSPERETLFKALAE